MRTLMRIFAFAVMASLLVLASCGAPEKEVRGTIKGEVEFAPGRYVIKGTLQIEAGAKFVIPAGSEVRLAKGSKIIVEGTFHIRALASKRVTFKLEDTDGFKVGTGFSDTRLLVNDAVLHLENCDFKGAWNESLVKARSANIRILKSNFSQGGKAILDSDGCYLDFTANRFNNRDMLTNDLRAQTTGGVVFIDNVFKNCSLAPDAILLDGRDLATFNNNSFTNCDFTGGESVVTIGRFGAVEFIDNDVRGNTITSGNTDMFVIDAYSNFSMLRNKFSRNLSEAGQSALLKIKARTATIVGNDFADNTGCTILSVAANQLSANTNMFFRNTKTSSLLHLIGRKGTEESYLNLLNCRFRNNTPDVFFKVMAFNAVDLHKNLFEGTDPSTGATSFIESTGNTSLAFHANTGSSIKWPEFITADLQTSAELEWVDPGNLIPHANLVEIDISQNELDRSNISLNTIRYPGESPAMSWRMQTNIIRRCDLSKLLPQAEGQVGATIRFNKFFHCDEALFTQNGDGACTEIDRNIFYGLKVLKFESGVNNPTVEFRIVANTFESSHNGITVKTTGEIFQSGNYFQNAVIWE